MLLEAHEYNQTMLQTVYQAYVQNDTKTFALFGHQRKEKSIWLNNLLFINHINRYDSLSHHKDFLNLKTYIHILLRMSFYRFRYVPTS